MITFLIVMLIILLTFLGFRLWARHIFRRYRGPEVPNFKGTRFQSPTKVIDHSLKDVFQWMWSREKPKWPALKHTPMPSPPARVEGTEVRITFVNHSTFLIQTQGINIVTDPVWSKVIGPLGLHGVKRLAEPGITFDQLPKIDAILVSHDHYDHLDLPTIRKIVKRDDAKIFAGLGVDTILKGKHITHLHIQTLGWWQEAQISDYIKVHFVPVQHWSGRWVWDRNASLWGGFVIETPTKKIFFAGDTGYGWHFHPIQEKFGPMDIALLPIGAYEPRWFMKDMHMNPEEAVKAHQDLCAKTSIAMHFGTFPLADEGYAQPIEDLQQALLKYKLSDQEFRVLPFGGQYKVK